MAREGGSKGAHTERGKGMQKEGRLPDLAGVEKRKLKCKTDRQMTFQSPWPSPDDMYRLPPLMQQHFPICMMCLVHNPWGSETSYLSWSFCTSSEKITKLSRGLFVFFRRVLSISVTTHQNVVK